jgi:hypothetical protein
MRAAEFKPIRAEACDGLIKQIAALAHTDPPLDLGSHPVTQKLVDEPSPQDRRAYKHREDLVDAALCTWTAALWHRHGVEYCQVLGEERAVTRPAATIIAPARSSRRS